MPTLKAKQPHELLDFDFNATRPLGADDVIESASATFTGMNQNLVIENVSFTDTTAKVWLSGGTDGAIYKITVLIKTFAGRTIEGEFILNVKDT
jgi:hypothetical protein